MPVGWGFWKWQTKIVNYDTTGTPQVTQDMGSDIQN